MMGRKSGLNKGKPIKSRIIPFLTGPSTPGTEKLGTFLGVFTPTILTILGVILYLRLGWVVGQVELVPTLGIVVLAHLITLVTAMSISAVATNMRVGGGWCLLHHFSQPRTGDRRSHRHPSFSGPDLLGDPIFIRPG